MYYEVKIKTLEVNEIGKEKCVTRTFLIDSMSFTEAEARMIEHAKVYVSDYEVISIARSKVNEVIENDIGSDEMKFFNVTVAYSEEADTNVTISLRVRTLMVPFQSYRRSGRNPFLTGI